MLVTCTHPLIDVQLNSTQLTTQIAGEHGRAFEADRRAFVWVTQKEQGTPTVAVLKGSGTDEQHSGFLEAWHTAHKRGRVESATFASGQQAARIWACAAQELSLDSLSCTSLHHSLTLAVLAAVGCCTCCTCCTCAAAAALLLLRDPVLSPHTHLFATICFDSQVTLLLSTFES